MIQSKGPHINATDYRIGKGAQGVSIAIPFEGNETVVESLLKHFNTRASLEQARLIFQKSGNNRNFAIIEKILQR